MRPGFDSPRGQSEAHPPTWVGFLFSWRTHEHSLVGLRDSGRTGLGRLCADHFLRRAGAHDQASARSAAGSARSSASGPRILPARRTDSAGDHGDPRRCRAELENQWHHLRRSRRRSRGCRGHLRDLRQQSGSGRRETRRRRCRHLSSLHRSLHFLLSSAYQHAAEPRLASETGRPVRIRSRNARLEARARHRSDGQRHVPRIEIERRHGSGQDAGESCSYRAPPSGNPT